MREIIDRVKETPKQELQSSALGACRRKNLYPLIEIGIIEQIKQVPIASLIEQELGISRHRNTYRCCFHDDHHPSLSVSSTKNLFYCHACGIGGDVITFVKKRYSLGFYEAVVFLADRLGISCQQTLSSSEIDRLKQKAQQRKAQIAELEKLEEFHKATENALYDALRGCRYRLPHHRRDVVFLDSKIYSESLIQEDELDRNFDELDQAVAERKKHFQEERKNVYRN